MYINVPQLSLFLQQYDPHKSYYFGRWPGMQRGGEANVKVIAPVRHRLSMVDDSRSLLNL